jgi:hypothetical protein
MFLPAWEVLRHNHNNKYTMALLVSTTVYGNLTVNSNLSVGTNVSITGSSGNALITTSNVWAGNLLTINGVFWANGAIYSPTPASANVASYVNTQQFTSGGPYYPLLSQSSGSGIASYPATNTSFTYNVGTNTLTAPNFSGTLAGTNVAGPVSLSNVSVYAEVTNVSSATTYYPTLSLYNATSNNSLTAASTLSFVPSTGNLTATGGFVGVHWGQAGITGGNIQGATTITTTANVTASSLIGNVYTYQPGTTTQYQAGYLLVPQNNQTAGYTLALSDAGKHIYVTTTATVTIPANSATAFPVGTTIALISGSGVTTTIAITSDTLYLGGFGTTGSRTLAAYGMASLIKVASTTWFISGSGLS